MTTFYRRIMAACDLSPQAGEVLKHAARLSRRLDAELIIVTIIQPKEVDSVKSFLSKIAKPKEKLAAADDAKERKKECYMDVQNLMRSIPRKDLKYKILIRTGLPYQEMIKIIHEKDVDMVIMGTRGNGKFKGRVPGATAERLFRLCPVPLLSIRTQQQI